MKNENMTNRVLEYIQYGMQPRIEIRPEEGFAGQLVTPGNFISGKELPLMMGIPHKSVTGLTVSSIAEFGRMSLYRTSGENAVRSDLGAFTIWGAQRQAR